MERGNTLNFSSLCYFGESGILYIYIYIYKINTEKFCVAIGGIFNVWNERHFLKETLLYELEFSSYFDKTSQVLDQKYFKNGY